MSVVQLRVWFDVQCVIVRPPLMDTKNVDTRISDYPSDRLSKPTLTVHQAYTIWPSKLAEQELHTPPPLKPDSFTVTNEQQSRSKTGQAPLESHMTDVYANTAI